MRTRLCLWALLMLGGCIAPGYDTGDVGVSVGYSEGFYEPWGYDYGGWDPGYRLGPPRYRDHDHGRAGPGGYAPSPAHMPHPPPHAIPSIPQRSRGGAGGGGGGHHH